MVAEASDGGLHPHPQQRSDIVSYALIAPTGGSEKDEEPS